ncbi:MAG: hypothetical protein A2Z12_00395 [Actinobacteria bacterium RBG_16_68_21]|nr:MAG: hypothetical protein A2Z12_00395 [Actinobacteria bacterium RBG_16_68_21]
MALLLGAKAVSGADHPPAALPAPHLVEEAAAAGIEHTYDGDFQFFVGGGVAVLDCDGDGRPDLYLAGGANPASLFRNESEVGGALKFAQVSDPATDLTGVTGAYPLDLGDDGNLDLVVLRVGENVLLRGLGQCRFERANEAWAFDGGRAWTVGFSAKWEAAASFPTLAFGNYLALDETGTPTGECEDNLLLRPDGAGGFSAATSLTPGWCTLSILFSDWDRSGQVDLRMANDRHYYRDGEEQLWRIAPGEAPRLYTHEEGWQRLQIWGMGIASYDVTGDGRPEVEIASQGDNKMQTLDEGATGPSYHDIAIRQGATAHRPFAGDNTLPSTAWHPEFQDVNNDGFIDLFISKGNVEAMEGFAARDPSNLLIGQPDGTFVEGARAAGFLSFGRGRGAALVDLNLDGLLDLVEINRREDVKVWRNTGSGTATSSVAMGNWVAVQLAQAGPNRDAIGAWVEVKVEGRISSRELTVGGGHASGQLGWIHFGLGEATSAEVRVRWPDGETGPWQRVAADTFAVVERGASELRVWDPAKTLPVAGEAP